VPGIRARGADGEGVSRNNDETLLDPVDNIVD
jgi:hypothetical protein